MLFGAVLVASFHLAYAEDGPVAAVQEALKKRQFYSGEITGKLDEATRAGLQQFQTQAGLPGTGEMDTSTLQALQRESSPPDASAPSGAQSDREFLKQVEKKEDGPLPAGPPAPAPAIEERAADPAPPSDQASSDEEKPAPKVQQKSPHVRPIEAHAKAPAVEKRSEPRKQKKSEDSISEGALEAPGATSHPREHLPQPATAAPLNPSETPLPRGSKVTTVTTTYAGPDGRIHTIERKTTTVPRTPKPFLQSFFGGKSSADRVDPP
jgi:peptidoglycan hydrolase-like protein with peptidoglycan-binding domain